MVSKTKLLGLAAAVALLATSASASILDWSFTAASGLSGSGTFTANQDMVDPAIFHLLSATGMIGGEAVTLSGYDGADNIAYATSPVLVDTAGIGFATLAGLFYNIYEDFGNNIPDAYKCGGVSQPYCIEGPNAFTVGAANVQALPTLSITVRDAGAVPEPATWGLMLVGFGGLGAAMRQRRKLAAA